MGHLRDAKTSTPASRPGRGVTAAPALAASARIGKNLSVVHGFGYRRSMLAMLAIAGAMACSSSPDEAAGSMNVGGSTASGGTSGAAGNGAGGSPPASGGATGSGGAPSNGGVMSSGGAGASDAGNTGTGSGGVPGTGGSSVAGTTSAGGNGGTSGTSSGGSSGAGAAGKGGSAGNGGAGNAGAGGGSSVVFPPGCKCMNLGPPSCTPTGHITYTLAKVANPTQTERSAYEAITCAMEGAVAYYNCNTAITKQLNVSYVPSVQTADGNINGSIRFGNMSDMQCVTAMHEIAHTVGVGQASNWGSFNMNGIFTGANATAELRAISGNAMDVLHCDSQHFWPYGLNYVTEAHSIEDLLDHCRIVTAIRKDLGLK
jgi:hypothetical protein